jgi:hypothetical protein
MEHLERRVWFMNKKWRTGLLVAMVIALLCVVAGFLLRTNEARAALERTRLRLRQEGFKLSVAEFELSASPEERARVAALDAAGGACRLLLAEGVDWRPAVGTNAARVLWNLPEFVTESCTNFWIEARLKLNQRAADQACQALLSGPCRPLPPVVRQGHLAASRGEGWWVPESLETRIMLALHDRDQIGAWTNLLALTHLFTAWRDQYHSMGFMSWTLGDLLRAYGVTWQALQAGGWDEPQLAALQREWEAADMRGAQAEQAAFGLAVVEFEYSRPWTPPGLSGGPSFFRSPITACRMAWQDWVKYLDNSRYRHSGRYLEEEALLRTLVDSQKTFTRIGACSTWKEIAALPEIRSTSPALASLRSSLTNFSDRFNTLHGIAQAFPFAFEPPIPSGPTTAWTWVCKIDSEAERRLTVVAIALERYRLLHGGYPESPESLVPGLLSRPLVDFMDGQPLRYRRTEDGRFLLYSTGRDCVDDGGGRADLIWPLPASAAEIAADTKTRGRRVPAQTTRHPDGSNR